MFQVPPAGKINSKLKQLYVINNGILDNLTKCVRFRKYPMNPLYVDVQTQIS